MKELTPDNFDNYGDYLKGTPRIKAINRLISTAYFLYRLRKVLGYNAKQASLIYGLKYTTYHKIETLVLFITYKHLLIVLQQIKMKQSELECIQEKIEECLSSVNYHYIEVDEETLLIYNPYELEKDIRNFDIQLESKHIIIIDNLIKQILQQNKMLPSLLSAHEDLEFNLTK